MRDAVLLDTPIVRMGTHRGLLVLDWLLTPTKESIHAVSERFRVLSAEEPTPFPLLSIIDAAHPPPPRPLLAVLTHEINAYRDALSAVAVVIEVKDLRSLAVRATITSLAVLSQNVYPVRVLSTVAAALEWLCAERRAPITATAESVAGCFEPAHAH
jgi:hypothetical protein